jgi:hypothetical protein
MNILNYVIDRLTETSTWRGLTFILTAVGIKLAPQQTDAIVAAGLALVGAINVFRRENE